MANEKLYIFDEQNIKIQVFETETSQLTSINDDAPTLIKIYEPGQRGPKGDDGGQYIPPDNLVSSSLQIASDISGSFVSASNSLSNRIGTLEVKTLVSSSQQINFEQISGSFSTSSFLQNSFTSSYNTFTSSMELKVQRLEAVTSSFVLNTSTSSFLNNSYTASNDLKVQRLEAVTSSFALKTEVSGAFFNVSSSLAGRIGVFESKTLFSGSSQVIYSQISNIPSGILSSSNGFVSSSTQVDFSTISNKPVIFSGSAQVVFNGISNVPSNIVSGSEQLTGSYDSRYERKGSGIFSSSQQVNTGSFSGSFYGNGANLTNIISASYAVTASYVSGSSTSAISASYALTASFAIGYVLNSQTSSMSVLSASYAPGSTLPSNIISSSNQIASDISGSFNTLSGSFANRIYSIEQSTGSLNTFSGSVNTRFNSIETKTGSYATTGSNQFNGNQSISGSTEFSSSIRLRYLTGDRLIYLDSLKDIRTAAIGVGSNFINGVGGNLHLNYAGSNNLYLYGGDGNTNAKISLIPTGISVNKSTANYPLDISGSVNMDNNLTVSGSILATSITGSFSGSFQGIPSSSAQIKELLPIGVASGSEQFTSSYDIRYERKGTGILSGSSQIASDISGSFTSLSGSITNRVYSIEQTTGSLNAISSSILLRLASIQSVTGSYATTGSNTFVGIETISGSLNITGSVNVVGQVSGTFVGNGSGLTGIVSSSYALSASYSPPQVSISSSYAATASVGGGIYGNSGLIPPNTIARISPNSSFRFRYSGSGIDGVLLSETTGETIISSPDGNGYISVVNGGVFYLVGLGTLDMLSGNQSLSLGLTGSYTDNNGNAFLYGGIYTSSMLTNDRYIPDVGAIRNNLTASFAKGGSGSFKGDGSGLTGVTATLSAGILSSSLQIASDISGSFTALSGSLNNRLVSLESTSGSLNSYTSSANSRFGSIEVKTGSYATTGSNIFIGTEIVSGSLNVTGSLNVIGTVSGTFIGNGSGLSGIVASAAPAGVDQSIQFNDSGTTSGSSDLLFDKVNKVLKLSGATSINAITSSGNIDNYLQINLQNKSNATTASSDIVATNDTGTEIGNYIDMGINGSGYNQPQFLGKANDGYLYTTGSKLIIGNITPAAHPSSSIDFVVGGQNATQNVRMTISSSGLVSASAFAGDGSRLTNVGGGITAGQAIAFAIALG